MNTRRRSAREVRRACCVSALDRHATERILHRLVGVHGTFDVAPIPAILLGMLTGIGGGMLQDILVAEIPTVLLAELYTVAAFGGAAVVVGGQLLGLPRTLLVIAGAALCFGLRLIALRRGCALPVADPVDPAPLHDRFG